MAPETVLEPEASYASRPMGLRLAHNGAVFIQVPLGAYPTSHDGKGCSIARRPCIAGVLG